MLFDLFSFLFLSYHVILSISIYLLSIFVLLLSSVSCAPGEEAIVHPPFNPFSLLLPPLEFSTSLPWYFSCIYNWCVSVCLPACLCIWHVYVHMCAHVCGILTNAGGLAPWPPSCLQGMVFLLSTERTHQYLWSRKSVCSETSLSLSSEPWHYWWGSTCF